MRKIGIIGASGYSGEVLVDLLSRHPKVKEFVVASSSHAGKEVETVLPHLAGSLDGLTFRDANPDQLPEEDVDLWLLALPHGVAAEFALPLVKAGRIVVDLSADFRLNSAETYERYYGKSHPAPDWLPKSPYVLPELPPPGWKKASLVACPGCYPTSVLLPLLPLLKERLIQTEGIVVNAVSGISGAGKKDSLFYSFCERADSVVAYGLGGHRHLSEMEEQMCMTSRKAVQIQFTPHLVPMPRGIATTITVRGESRVEDIYACWRKVYARKRGVRLLPAGQCPETCHLLGRNRIDMAAYKDERTGNILITSAIDNLMKGAGGQAVQIMNLRLGWPEFSGLT